MLINFFILPDSFQVNHISVYCFHDIIAGPSSPLQNILVWYAYGVHNGCSIMPEVVKAEMGYINLFEYSSESVCDVIRVHINQLSFFFRYPVNYKCGHFYIPCTIIRFRLFDVPLIVWPLDNIVSYMDNTTLYIFISKGAYLSASEWSKGC